METAAGHRSDAQPRAGSPDVGSDQAATPPVRITRPSEDVAVLTLARPKSRNALSREMLSELTSALEKAHADQAVRAIVLAGEGPAFCAGHDLKELTARRADADGGKAFFAETMQACSQLMQTIVHLPTPVIASVDAMATAAGCQLVASCDLAVATNQAGFCTPGVNIGLFCSTPMVALSRNIPRKQAMEMLLLGEVMTPDDAKTYGLINKVVDGDTALPGALEFAARIASKSAHTVGIGKTAFYRQAEQSLSDAYDFAVDVMVQNMMANDACEGIGAFLEKRSPKWSDN